MNLVSPSEHQLLIFWVQILVLLGAARLLGTGMRKIGQPGVVGELLAGVLLGPSVLGQVAPGVLDFLLPDDALQSGMLFALAWIGILLLLIETGFETDLALIRRLGRATAFVSTFSIVVPLAGGLVVGMALPDIFRGDLGDDVVFTLFIGTALSISSLAVAGKVLSELGVMRRDFGQITLAAGMANDTAGWIMLGIIASLATAGELSAGSLAVTIGGIAALFIGGLTLGQRGVDRLLRTMRDRGVTLTGYLSVLIILALVAGVATQLVGAEAVLGAFILGIIVNRSPSQMPEVRERLAMVTTGIFAPIFFATAGLRVDLGLLADVEVARWAVVVIATGSLAKFAGAFIGARMASLHPIEGILLGIGLNPRGTVEIVIATVGLSVGVFNDASYTVIMLMTIVLSIAAAPLLRMVARTWHGNDEEQRRLSREQTLSENLIVRTNRMLVPTKGGPNSIVAAQVLHLVWPAEVGATLLVAGKDADEAGISAVTGVFGDRPVRVERESSDHAPEAILREANLGYGVIGVGAPDAAQGPWILSPIVDELLNSTSVPVVIVRRARNLDRPTPAAFARAIVAVAPSAASRAAQEIAFSLSAAIGTEIVLTHVVVAPDEPSSVSDRGPLAWRRRAGTPAGSQTRDPRERTAETRNDMAARVLDRADDLGRELEARTRSIVRSGSSKADQIVAAASEENADLVILGANLRQLEGRPFLGHGVEQILEECDATVVVVATPTGPHG